MDPRALEKFAVLDPTGPPNDHLSRRECRSTGHRGTQEESILRRRGLDCSDPPRPEPRFPVKGPIGGYELDLADPVAKDAAEYDGAVWHGDGSAAYNRVNKRRVGEMAEGPVRCCANRTLSVVDQWRRCSSSTGWRPSNW